MYLINRKFPSCLTEVKKNLTEILSILDKYIKDETILFNIRLILNELVINGVEHGNCYDTSKYVELSIWKENGEMIIRVKDQGRGINRDREEYNPKCLKDCGRGLHIVQQLARECIIENNEIIAKIRI